MKPVLHIVIASLAGLAATAATAECATSVGPSIACVHPMNAALAWQVYRSDRKAINDSNNKQLLRESQCTILHPPQYPLRISMGPVRVATNNGWASIAEVSAPEVSTALLWISTNYLAAACEGDRTVPKVQGRDATFDWRGAYPPLAR